MRVEGKVTSPALVVWAVAVALILLFSSALVQAQGDGPQEDLTLEELQEQQEVLAQEAAEVAASIDLSEATVEEVSNALDELGTLTDLQQIRLEDATARYDSAIARVAQTEADHAEIVETIDETREIVTNLSLAAFTGEVGVSDGELVLSIDPNKAARFIHLLDEQTGDLTDSLDRLRSLEIEAEELIAERDLASQQAEESLAEVEARAAALSASIAEQQALLELAESRLGAELLEADSLAEQAEELDVLIEEMEQRIADAVKGVGSPAPVNREDIVQLSFFDGEGGPIIFQIQVHKDIEEETRALYELAFSQGINLGGWGYRTTDRQIALRESHCGGSSYDIWLKPANECSPPTARPGFSKHEQGRAIDFQWNGGSIGSRSGAAFQWLAANAPQFGFVNLPSEPWHWSDGSGITFDPNVPIPEIPEDAIAEVEPDAETAELLKELADLDEELEGSEEELEDGSDEGSEETSEDVVVLGATEVAEEEGTTDNPTEPATPAEPAVDATVEQADAPEPPADVAPANDSAPAEEAPEQAVPDDQVAEDDSAPAEEVPEQAAPEDPAAEIGEPGTDQIDG